MLQLVVDEVITEGLESDNLTLQNLSANKYVQVWGGVVWQSALLSSREMTHMHACMQANSFFLERVTAWQRKLGAVDAVLSTWADVQKKWQALESIFVGSADIRTQLPQDSQRFDGLNASWQELMREAPALTSVVEACGREGRAERLDALLEGLETCEKALQDYLETKRVAFPRFYFVAPADLLDLLSKGSDPQAILRRAAASFGVLQSSSEYACKTVPPLHDEAGTCPSASTTCTTWSSRRTRRAPPPGPPSACTPVSGFCSPWLL